MRVSFFGASCASAFAAFFAFSGFAPSAFSALFRVVRGRFAGFGIGSEIFPMNAVSFAAALSGWSCFFCGASPSYAGLINLFTFFSDKQITFLSKLDKAARGVFPRRTAASPA